MGHLRGHVRASLRLGADGKAEGILPRSVHRRLQFAPRTLPTTLGPLPLQSVGFMLTGVPRVMVRCGEDALREPQVAMHHPAGAETGQ